MQRETPNKVMHKKLGNTCILMIFNFIQSFNFSESLSLARPIAVQIGIESSQESWFATAYKNVMLTYVHGS